MSVLKSWTGGLVVLLALAGGLRAEVMVGQSDSSGAGVQPDLMSVLLQERSSFDSVPAARVAQLVAPTLTEGAPAEMSDAWLDAQPAPQGNPQLDCLASAIYHEARGESVEGQQAVAEVVLNRVDDASFPKTVCGVVEQRAQGSCQFSFTCDGKSDAPTDQAAFVRAEKLARAMLDGFPRSVTDGATYFHTRKARPDWSRRFIRTAQVGAHLFYRRPIMTASN